METVGSAVGESAFLAANSPVRVTLPVNTEYQRLDKLKYRSLT